MSLTARSSSSYQTKLCWIEPGCVLLVRNFRLCCCIVQKSHNVALMLVLKVMVYKYIHCSVLCVNEGWILPREISVFAWSSSIFLHPENVSKLLQRHHESDLKLALLQWWLHLILMLKLQVAVKPCSNIYFRLNQKQWRAASLKRELRKLGRTSRINIQERSFYSSNRQNKIGQNSCVWQMFCLCCCTMNKDDHKLPCKHSEDKHHSVSSKTKCCSAKQMTTKSNKWKESGKLE